MPIDTQIRQLTQIGIDMPNTNLPTAQGGLNLRDSLDVMPERDCIQMDNVIPDVGVDRVRPGFREISENSAAILMSYNEVGSEEVLAADSGSVYTVDLSDGSFTLIGSGFTNNDWLYTSFADGAGAIHTIMANGSDVAQDYNGTTLANVGFTIPGGVTLNKPLSFKNRLYFVDEGTTDLYYGGVQSISGTLTQFPLAGFFKLGGEIAGIANWTQDAGEGIDDLLVVFSTEGEVLLYRGTSPAASDWSLRGVFRISRPIGKRFVEKMGGDLVVLTEQGYFPLSQVLNQDRANRVAISDKINPIVNGKDFTHHFFTPGWFATDYESFLTNHESSLFISSLTKVVLYEIDKDILNNLYQKEQQFEKLGRIIAEKAYLFTVEKMSSLQTLDLKDRYKRLVDKMPELFQSVPQKYIASYLGVSEQSLSRIKAS